MESPAAPAAGAGQRGLPRGTAPAGKDASAALRRCRIFRYPLARQLVRFTAVGVACTAVSLALYAFLRPWIGAQPANAAALIIASLMNTALNRRVTFKIAGRRRLKRDHLNGLIVIVVALLITGGSLAVLHWVRPDASVSDELWTTTLSGFIATAVRFTLFRHWIFRRARHGCAPAFRVAHGDAPLP